MNLVIGSANFGSSYGILNNKKINRNDLKKIFRLSLKNKIHFIDSAIDYPRSHLIIGKTPLRKLKVITKIKLPSGNNILIKNWILKKINLALKELKIKKLYCLMIHDVEDVLGKNKIIFLKTLFYLKKKKIIKKIGVSVYSPLDLKKILKIFKPDIVQFPYNIFDSRMLNDGLLKRLKNSNITTYARSCLLQGLLLSLNSNILSSNINNKFNFKFKKKLIEFEKWCNKKKINSLQASLHFVKQVKLIDYVVVGFNNFNQFKEIVFNYKKKTIRIPNKFYCNDLNLIDPRKWKK
jgi:aryl-alcohol dehydrogenase-like predicted oxidoreductase